MSIPTIGFPDYSRYQPNGGRYLGSCSGNIGTSPSTEPISSVGFGYITLITFANGVSANYFVGLNWGDNSDPVERITDTQYVARGDSYNVTNWQVIAEWFTVEHDYVSGSTSESPTTYIYGSNVPEIGPPLGGSGSQYLNVNTNVGAGTTTYFSTVGCWGGKAMLGVSNLTGTEWYAQIQQYNPDTAAYENLYQIGGSSYGFSAVVPVALPPAPTRVGITNTAGAAVAFTISLVPYG